MCEHQREIEKERGGDNYICRQIERAVERVIEEGNDATRVYYLIPLLSSRLLIIFIFRKERVDICKITLSGIFLHFELGRARIKYYEFLFFLMKKRPCGNSRAQLD